LAYDDSRQAVRVQKNRPREEALPGPQLQQKRSLPLRQRESAIGDSRSYESVLAMTVAERIADIAGRKYL